MELRTFSSSRLASGATKISNIPLLPHQTKQVAPEKSHKGTGLLSSFLTRKKRPPILFCVDGSPPGKEAATLIFPPKCLKSKLELIFDTAPLSIFDIARYPMRPERSDEDAHTQVPRDLKLKAKQRIQNVSTDVVAMLE